MREEVKIVELDKPEQGAMYTALLDLHNKRIAEGKSTETIDGLLGELENAPTKKRKVRGDYAR
jgi:hypothetical protein